MGIFHFPFPTDDRASSQTMGVAAAVTCVGVMGAAIFVPDIISLVKVMAQGYSRMRRHCGARVGRTD